MARALFKRQKASWELSESRLLPMCFKDDSLYVRAMSKLCAVLIGDPSTEAFSGLTLFKLECFARWLVRWKSL